MRLFFPFLPVTPQRSRRLRCSHLPRRHFRLLPFVPSLFFSLFLPFCRVLCSTPLICSLCPPSLPIPSDAAAAAVSHHLALVNRRSDRKMILCRSSRQACRPSRHADLSSCIKLSLEDEAMLTSGCPSLPLSCLSPWLHSL